MCFIVKTNNGNDPNNLHGKEINKIKGATQYLNSLVKKIDYIMTDNVSNVLLLQEIHGIIRNDNRYV